jgi:hypothetical protein
VPFEVLHVAFVLLGGSPGMQGRQRVSDELVVSGSAMPARTATSTPSLTKSVLPSVHVAND